jgi:hypothetical protein
MFKKTIEVQELEKILMKMDVGDVLTYEEINEKLQIKDITKKRWILQSARNYALRNGYVFDSIRKVGIKRLADYEIIDFGQVKIQSIGNASKRVIRTQSAVNFNELDHEDKIRHNTHMAVCRFIYYECKSKSLVNLSSKVTVDDQSITLGRTLKLFEESD